MYRQIQVRNVKDRYHMKTPSSGTNTSPVCNDELRLTRLALQYNLHDILDDTTTDHKSDHLLQDLFGFLRLQNQEGINLSVLIILRMKKLRHHIGPFFFKNKSDIM